MLSPNEIEQMYRRQGVLLTQQGDLRVALGDALRQAAGETAHAAEGLRLGHPHSSLQLGALELVVSLRRDLDKIDREMDEIGVRLRLGGEIPTRRPTGRTRSATRRDAREPRPGDHGPRDHPARR